jgi:hypothetical protein
MEKECAGWGSFQMPIQLRLLLPLKLKRKKLTDKFISMSK